MGRDTEGTWEKWAALLLVLTCVPLFVSSPSHWPPVSRSRPRLSLRLWLMRSRLSLCLCLPRSMSLASACAPPSFPEAVSSLRVSPSLSPRQSLWVPSAPVQYPSLPACPCPPACPLLDLRHVGHCWFYGPCPHRTYDSMDTLRHLMLVFPILSPLL